MVFRMRSVGAKRKLENPEVYVFIRSGIDFTLATTI